jgi:hypothetical protein
MSEDDLQDSASIKGPGKSAIGVSGITFITAYLMAVSLLVIWALVALWPPLKPSELPGNKNTNGNANSNANANENGNQNKNANANSKVNANANSQANTNASTNRNANLQTNANANVGPNTNSNSNVAPPDNASVTASHAGPRASPNPDCEAKGISGDSCYDEDGKVRKGVAPAKVFGWCGCMYDEDRLLLIVLLAGALGSLIHGLRSFVFYVGSRRAVRSWSAYYMALPFIGAGLAFIFYLVIRGGFFSTGATVENTSPVGFAAVAALIGMFTEQAVQKLQKISDSILSPAEKGKDHITGPKITGISPKVGPTNGGNKVTIAGENFSAPVKVTFGGVESKDIVSTSNSITVIVPAHPGDKEGKVDLVVINADNQQDTAREGYEYKNEPIGQQPGGGPVPPPPAPQVKPGT